MSTPLPIPIPLPITSDAAPDWWVVGLTAANVIASAVVAISALLSARQATKIAEESEKARVEAERVRAAREYDSRFEEALVVFIDGITKHLGELRPLNDPSPAPMADGVVSAIQLVRLRARDADAEVISKAADLLNRVLKVGISRQTKYEVLSDLVIKLREWRTAARTRDNLMGWLDSTAGRF